MGPREELEILEMQAATPADRARLRRVVDAVSRLEKLSAVSTLLVGALAFLSFPLWILTTFPHLMPEAARYFIVAWVPAALGLAAVTLAIPVVRRRARRIADCTTAPSPALHPASGRPR